MSLSRDLADSALLVPRLLGSLSRALPDVVEQLPGTVYEVRRLVSGLVRLAEPDGALTRALESAASPEAWREGRPVERADRYRSPGREAGAGRGGT